MDDLKPLHSGGVTLTIHWPFDKRVELRVGCMIMGSPLADLYSFTILVYSYQHHLYSFVLRLYVDRSTGEA